MTTTTPLSLAPCGLNQPGIRREESEAPHWSAARTDTFMAARFKRLSRRLGNKKAIVAVAHTIIIAIWHVLSNDEDYQDLGADWYAAWDPKARTRSLIRRLEALGNKVTIEPAA